MPKATFATTKDLGDGFTVRRSLPTMTQKSIGPFVFWDHMGPTTIKNGQDFKVRAHPHIGLATVTYLFSGEIVHRDSLGFEQTIRPGEVNWMTAGKGIVHSERVESETDVHLEGIQLWVALPKEHEQAVPTFIHAKEADIPQIEQNGSCFKLIVGSAFGHTSPIRTFSPMFYLASTMEAEKTFEMPVTEKSEAAVYIVSGKVRSDGNDYEAGTLIVFEAGEKIDLKTLAETKIMIFGGEKFPEKRYLWWNFVSSSRELIETAKLDWKENRFPQVFNETEKIPLPDH